MSFSTRLDKIEAAMRGRDPPDEPFWVCRRLIYDPRKWEIGKEEAVSRMKAEELDRLVASGDIREVDRDRVRWIVHTIVHPPEWPDVPQSKKSDT
jgi:hypothetical protein